MAKPREERFIRTTKTPSRLQSIPARRLPSRVGRMI
jgi:hypothetical protein